MFDLGGEELVKMQEDFSEKIFWYFGVVYKSVVESIKKDEQFKVDIKKIYEEDVAKLGDFSEEIIEELEGGVVHGMNYLNKDFINTQQVTTALWISNTNAVNRASENSARLITQISEVTQKRINKLVTDAVEGSIWVDELIETLETDYSFSKYRATFIASNELWNAYISWKELQFNEYQREYGIDGRKKRVSHRDEVTTDLCLENDLAWWIMYGETFPSWDLKPLRFPWCRCNEEFKLFKPV